jgi:hyperosmotically inducible periplasmic protein
MKFSIVTVRNVLAVLLLGLTVGCAGAFTKAGQAMDDTAITTKVKAAMARDKDVSATSVSVETVKGEVRLSGFVNTSAEKQRAEQLALQTEGVRSVQNALVVRPSDSSSGSGSSGASAR